MSNKSVAPFNQETDLVDARQIQEVTIDFSKQMDELDKAIQLTKDAGVLAESVQEKGVFGTFFGSISGKNDKQLAESVKILGASVETTQKIIEVILKVNNVKNQFLRSFHTALTDKILSLNREMEISYGNQKNAKQATITIATQLRAQIDEKIRHAEMIDEHEVEISQLQEFAKTKDILDEEQSEAISEFKEKAILKDDLDHQQSRAISFIKEVVAQNENIDQIQTQDIEYLKEITNNNDRLDNQQTDDIIKLNDHLTKLHSLYENQFHEIQMLKDKDAKKDQHIKNQYQRINVLTEKNDMLQDSIELITNNFNKYIAECNSAAYKLKVLALPLLSLLIASAAIYFALK